MIILGRHGNTFAPGQKAVWVGARSDLPLTTEGMAQARRVADYLRQVDLKPAAVIAGPLRRTADYADVIASAFGLKVEIDPDLRELDYGAWEGLDSSTVVRLFGTRALDGWENHLTWPDDKSNWGESFEIVRARACAALHRLSALQPVFACTSNGVLRMMASVMRGSIEPSHSKVRTGAVCHVVPGAKGYEIAEWNHLP